jgi:ribonuclease HI
VHITDGSGFKGDIWAAALLYIGECLVKVLRLHLGSAAAQTVYKAEGIGLLLGVHLLKGLSRLLTHATVLGTDNQAVIKALDNQTPHAGQYILDAIHKTAEELNAKQDCLINHKERARAIDTGNEWVGRTKGVIDLQIHWVLGHQDFEPNEHADGEAKKAAQGDSSDAKSLPALLCEHLPLSISALQQNHSAKTLKSWEHRWKASPRRA